MRLLIVDVAFCPGNLVRGQKQRQMGVDETYLLGQQPLEAYQRGRSRGVIPKVSFRPLPKHLEVGRLLNTTTRRSLNLQDRAKFGYHATIMGGA